MHLYFKVFEFHPAAKNINHFISHFQPIHFPLSFFLFLFYTRCFPLFFNFCLPPPSLSSLENILPPQDCCSFMLLLRHDLRCSQCCAIKLSPKNKLIWSILVPTLLYLLLKCIKSVMDFIVTCSVQQGIIISVHREVAEA